MALENDLMETGSNACTQESKVWELLIVWDLLWRACEVT